MSDNRPTNDPVSLAFMRGGLTRRDLLRRAGIAGGTLAGASLIAACGGGSASTGGGGGASVSGPVSIDKTVAPNWTFSNWPLYIDIKNKTDHPSLDLFDKKYKTKTNYQEDIEDNDSFFGKVQAQLKANQDIGRDIVTLTDWMAAKWVALGYCEQLDLSLLPNVEANLVDALKGRSIDPQNNHLVPWQSGFTGLAYNPELTGFEVKNVEDLWHPNLKGKVTLLTEMRDTLGLTMLQLGIDPTKCTVDDAQKACDYLQTYVNNGQIRRFTGNDYASDLAKGNVYACMAWSGDIVQLQLDNPKLKFVFPEKGVDALDGQHDDPQKRVAPVQRAPVDELLLPARDRGHGRGLRQLCVSRQWGEGRAAEEGSHSGQQPADLPDAGHTLELVRVQGADAGGRAPVQPGFPAVAGRLTGHGDELR